CAQPIGVVGDVGRTHPAGARAEFAIGRERLLRLVDERLRICCAWSGCHRFARLCGSDADPMKRAATGQTERKRGRARQKAHFHWSIPSLPLFPPADYEEPHAEVKRTASHCTITKSGDAAIERWRVRPHIMSV